MIEMPKWTARRFIEKPDAGVFPMLLERLAGTPARAAAKLAAVPSRLHARRIADAWSIQEHVGHLWIVEELWEKRFDEYLAGAKELTAADMSNRKTHESDLNSIPAGELLDRFRRDRTRLVGKLEMLDLTTVERESYHPRLQQPMRLIDLCLFIAEHDDHHLALMTRTWREHTGNRNILGQAEQRDG